MDFELDDDQRAILEAVTSLLVQHAGFERAMELAAKGEYDFALEGALAEAGFLGVARGEGTGPLEAALLLEAVARAAGTAAVGAAALVAPMLTEAELPTPIALAVAGGVAPVRFAAHARTLLLVDGDVARVLRLEPGDADAVPSNFGFPLGRLLPGAGVEVARLEPGSAARALDWWRVAIAVETVGTMAAALEVTLDYVKKRRQFGRAIGSFQGVQHRLAQCEVLLQGSRWLALEAAARGAPREAAAVAAAHALAAARRVFDETHQFSGAMGFTREHDLHVWSMRLQALRLELDAAAQRRAVAEARWVRGA